MNVRRSIDVVQMNDRDVPLDDATPVTWTVSVSDDYDDSEPRVQLTVEPVGAAGEGLVVHLGADGARRLRRALADGLREIGHHIDDSDPGREPEHNPDTTRTPT